MKLYSTNDPSLRADFREAVFQALPRDRGLYMPTQIKPLPADFWSRLPDLDLPSIAVAITQHLLDEVIASEVLDRIVREAIDFPAPLVPVAHDEMDLARQYVLELFHGPSLAFKDFGARFMAGVMDHFLTEDSSRLVILVATSGDTGGAVAAGFHGSENIDVIILYPAGKVSDVQEAQLTTLSRNVTALRIEGSFDDCQALVKEAFVDHALRAEVHLSSANSINIARLIPQTFYYVEAYRQWMAAGETSAPVFSVPSGNFGNLTAGVIAAQLGLPVRKFIAATNANDTVVRYANTGEYEPRASVPTLSNAMDVGTPSNYVRMSTLLGSTWNNFRDKVYASSFTDADTEAEMRRGFRQNPSYTYDPHTAVGSLALRKYQREVENVPGIVLGTAHPAKFSPDVERVLETKLEMPKALQWSLEMRREMTDLPVDYASVREVILQVWRKRT